MSTLKFLTIASLFILSFAQSLQASSLDPISPTSILLDDPKKSCLDSGFYDCSKCPCELAEDFFKIAVAGVSVFSIVWGVVFIFIYLLLKEARQKPGEIIVVQTLANIILGVKAAIENWHLLQQGAPEMEEDSNQCKGLAFLHVFLVNLIYLYPFAFYMYQAVTLQNPIYASRITRRYYHSTTFSVVGILTAVEFGIKGVGRNTFGTCTFRTTSIVFLPMIVYGAFLFFFAYLGYSIHQLAYKRQQDLNRKESNFVQHYLVYLIMLCLILLGHCLVEHEIATKVSDSREPDAINKERTSLNTLQLAVIVMTNLSPLLLVIARIRDPAIWKGFKKGLAYVCCCQCCFGTSEAKPIHEIGDIVSISDQDSKSEQTKGLLDRDSLEFPRLQGENFTFKPVSYNDKKSLNKSLNKSTNKAEKVKDPQMFYSIFAGIHYLWYLQKTEKADLIDVTVPTTKDEEEYEKKEVKVKKKFSVQGAVLKQHVPHIYREIRNKNYKIRTGIFTAYAPNLFQEFIELDAAAAELRNSLALVSNFHNIVNTATTNTQFQFVTYNQKFLLRSISKGERRVLLRILPRYLNYLKTRPYSLLARIYGIFRFEVMSPYRQVNWIIMKNTSERSVPCVDRVYQLKGLGRYRETVVHGSEVTSLVMRGSELLKDGDFERFEQNISMDPSMKKSYLDSLRHDVEFLRNEKIIDYSLIVTVVNGNKLYSIQNRLSSSVILEVEESLEDKSMTLAPFGCKEEEKQEYKKNMALVSNVHIQNPFCHMKSLKANMYYNLEIDNFFTQYDWKRRWKTFVESWRNEDSKLQPPGIYAGRFLQYMQKIGQDSDDFFGNVNHEEAQEGSIMENQ